MTQVTVDDMQADAVVFQDGPGRAQPDQVKRPIQSDIHAGKGDAPVADQIGRLPIPPRLMRLDRHSQLPRNSLRYHR